MQTSEFRNGGLKFDDLDRDLRLPDVLISLSVLIFVLLPLSAEV